jgi:hypothetical protein
MLYASINAPIDADKHGAIPPEVKNAIFMKFLNYGCEN